MHNAYQSFDEDPLLSALGVYSEHRRTLTPIVTIEAETRDLNCAKSETLSPPPSLDEEFQSISTGARRHMQPPGAGRQLPRGDNVSEDAALSAVSQSQTTSLAENVKKRARKPRATKAPVKEKSPPKVKKEKIKKDLRTSKRVTKTK